jgi:SRSO17 transposase
MKRIIGKESERLDSTYVNMIKEMHKFKLTRKQVFGASYYPTPRNFFVATIDDKLVYFVGRYIVVHRAFIAGTNDSHPNISIPGNPITI